MTAVTVTARPFADRDGQVVMIVRHGCMIEHLRLGRLSFDNPDQIAAAAVRALSAFGLDADQAAQALKEQ